MSVLPAAPAATRDVGHDPAQTNRNIHLRRYVARAAAFLIMAGVAVGTATGTAHAETKECTDAMAGVDWALSNYEGAINSGNRSDIRFWQKVSRDNIESMDAACG
jgi:hypothetical protein